MLVKKENIKLVNELTEIAKQFQDMQTLLVDLLYEAEEACGGKCEAKTYASRLSEDIIAVCEGVNKEGNRNIFEFIEKLESRLMDLEAQEEDDSCYNCGGSGGGPDPALYCPMCGGRGELRRERYVDPETYFADRCEDF